MEFEWDDKKNAANLRKHGVSFEQAIAIFKGLTMTIFDDWDEYGETRQVSIGETNGYVVLLVVHTERQMATRIISARRATRNERNKYYEYCQKIFE